MSLAITMLAAAGTLAACGETTATDAAVEAKTIYTNTYAKGIPYFDDWQAGAAARAGELGWTVESEQGNGTPEQQVRQIENALTSQPDAILLTPIDEESLVPVLKMAQEQGVAVITIGAGTSDPEATITSHVARDNFDLGAIKAEYVAEQLGGEGKVGIVHGIRGLAFTAEQADAYEQTFAELAPDIEIVDGPYTGGVLADLGLDAAASLLASSPDLDAIIFDNDDLAAGGVEAIANAGIDNDAILVIGTDGGAIALDAVEAGEIDMTVNLCGFREGSSGIDALSTFYMEGSVEPRIVSDIEIFTSDTAGDLRAELDQRIECN